MKLSSLKLRNFRSHRETSFEFERINILRGPNGSGKSSIQMSLEMLLTGRCECTDQAGRGAQSLISSGATELSVEAILSQPPHTLLPMNYKRSVTGGQTIIGPHAGASAYQWLEANVAPIPCLAAVLNAHRFLQMNAKEQKALLANALAPTPVAIDPEIRELHERIAAGFPMQETVASAEQVEALYDWHFKQRTNVNRDIKALGELQAPEEPEEKHSLAEVRAMIDQIRNERDQKVREREQLLADFKSRATRLQAAKAQKAMYEPDLLESEQLEQCRKDAKNLKKHAQLKAEIAQKTLNLDELKREFQRVSNCKQQETCPTCGQPIPGKDEIDDGWVEKVEAEIAVKTADLTEKQSELRKMPDPTLAQDKIGRHQRAMKPYQAAEMLIKEIGDLGDEPSTAAIDEEIKAIDHRIICGNEVADAVSKYEGAKQQYDKSLATLEKKRELSEALDRLVEYFSDKGGLKAKLIDSKLPAFRDRINDTLHRFGFECEFELEPYALSLIQLDDTGGRRTAPLQLQQLSESEQYRFSIAFSIALAEATGVKLVIVDRADMLSVDARGELASILIESDLDQAFVLCTGEPSPTPDIADVKFFELANDDGMTRVILAEEMAHAGE